MYGVIWDTETNGVVLIPDKDKSLNVSPRPVFFEELDLLGFDKKWRYPHTQEPLLWRAGRRYYYKGKLVAEANGGGIYEDPTLEFTEEGKHLVLEPINISGLIAENSDQLSVLQNEAIDFVNHIYKRYKDKVSALVVSFSGGKDSQVILDIVSKVIPPSDYMVIFTDTTMEIPPTYETFEKTKALYKPAYPELKFYTARNWKKAEETWKEFGPPGMMLRWCCSVHKSAPMIRLVRNLVGKTDNVRIVVFDGVREEESARRKGYSRLAENVKHFTQVNAEVIKYWSTTEVYLYIIAKGLPLNSAYRRGLDRVGCSVCPYGSNWWEYIIGRTYPDSLESLMNEVEKSVKLLGVEDGREFKKYISDGNWKKRGGGEGVDTGTTRLDIVQESSSHEKFVLSNPGERFEEWIKVLGPVRLANENGKVNGDVLASGRALNFSVSSNGGVKTIVDVTGIEGNRILIGRINKLAYKSTYCVHCGVCEVVCPTGALSVMPAVSINTSLCIHCYNCLDFVEKGCLRAKSVATMVSQNEGGKEMTSSTGFGRYLRFGLRSDWLKDFFGKGDKWVTDNVLGPKQVEAMLSWLRDAELMDSKKKTVTVVYEQLRNVFEKDELLAFELIWVNLFYNSGPVFWFLTRIPWGKAFTSNELKQMVESESLPISKRTISSGIDSLMNTFQENIYLEKMGAITVIKRNRERIVVKTGANNVHPLALLYSLYRYALNKGYYDLTVHELYDEANKTYGGPYVIFGIERQNLERLLRGMQEQYKGLINVDLVADLDNIHLNSSIKNSNALLEECSEF
ncbi:phosphoadenosine phosphosulfate reductase family protein [Coprothermobacter platensis]|uniref:phosphoadenosine phosphosulfate reductase domain-containing protein n=1 Tax=Coprothermobacter platensis TaxID=108819 RepID=UPI00037C9E17|nr:phosphoadenosine phosphosulfate reductase family protein [Coprothermobacter platensis]